MKHSITYHSVPRETFDSVNDLYIKFRPNFEAYINQLFWWNEHINLVSRDVPRETIVDHIKHSLFLHEFDRFRKSNFIVDAGTGGGLPGLPLAIPNQCKTFLLNDIVSKKVLAVKQMAQKLSIDNANTFDRSIAELEIDHPLLLISKHAFKINNLFHLAKNLPWTSMIFYKGVGFEDELQNIETPLSISIFDLFENSEKEFYKDKAIIIVSR